MEKVTADLIVRHAAQLVTVAGATGNPKRGRDLAEIGMIEDGAVAARDGLIVAVGTSDQVAEQVAVHDDALVLDAHGQVVLPGLVDPHTHAVFAGSREHELEMKIGGMGYLEILAQGGGILDTVRATRAASQEQLAALGQGYLAEMLAQGTTTAEIKSGYGLSVADELKMLRVIRDLGRQQPVELVATFLGAHAVPQEFAGDTEGYVRLVIDEMLPAVARERLASYCDVFCEDGVFSPEQSRRILIRALQLGMQVKLHADEIVSLGGAELAVELRAVSADHLMAVSDQGIRELAASGTIAVLLPATTFCLMQQRYAPARRMIEEGVAVAMASDFNPGSCPVSSLQVAMGIACRQMQLLPAEVISAATINAAHAIGRAQRVGSLEVGKQADLVVFDAPNYRYLMYRFGANLVRTVIKSGRIVIGG